MCQNVFLRTRFDQIKMVETCGAYALWLFVIVVNTKSIVLVDN